MFEVLNKEGQVIDTASTLLTAQNVVTFLTGRQRDMAPYHCRPAAAA